MPNFSNNPGSEISKDQHLKNLQDKLQKDEQSIQQIKSINEEAIKIWVAQASVHKYILEDLLRLTSPKVTEIESQLAKNEVTAWLLEPVDYRNIIEEARAWDNFIRKPAGPT